MRCRLGVMPVQKWDCSSYIWCETTYRFSDLWERALLQTCTPLNMFLHSIVELLKQARTRLALLQTGCCYTENQGIQRVFSAFCCREFSDFFMLLEVDFSTGSNWATGKTNSRINKVVVSFNLIQRLHNLQNVKRVMDGNYIDASLTVLQPPAAGFLGWVTEGQMEEIRKNTLFIWIWEVGGKCFKPILWPETQGFVSFCFFYYVALHALECFETGVILSIFSIPCLARRVFRSQLLQTSVSACFLLGFWTDMLTALLNKVRAGSFLPLQVCLDLFLKCLHCIPLIRLSEMTFFKREAAQFGWRMSKIIS